MVKDDAGDLFQNVAVTTFITRKCSFWTQSHLLWQPCLKNPGVRDWMSICSPKLSIYREIKQQKSGNFALPEPCIPVAVPFGMLAHQCPPQTWVTEALHNSPSFYTLTASQLPFALVCFYFCFSDDIVENGEDHKNAVLLYQDSRFELCREQSAWLLHWLRSRIPVVLLPQSSCYHTPRPSGSKTRFSFPSSSLPPKIKKNDMDIVIPSLTVPAEQEEDTKA